MPEILRFTHHAMATYFEVRLVNQPPEYARQAAQAAFALADRLESQLSRFRAESELAQLVRLAPGESKRLGEATFACLELAQRIERATGGAFSITAAALRSQPGQPQWSLQVGTRSIQCRSGVLAFDLGAIGKGFALDRMGEMLRQWNCSSFLLVAGGSSILAGEAPDGTKGWSCGLGEDDAPQRYWLQRSSLSGSGLAVNGLHILDPRSGEPAQRRERAWALADTAAESDALSTACMVLSEPELEVVLAAEPEWLVFLESAEGIRAVGRRGLPRPALG